MAAPAIGELDDQVALGAVLDEEACLGEFGVSVTGWGIVSISFIMRATPGLT
jgi:hypothetical protein